MKEVEQILIIIAPTEGEKLVIGEKYEIMWSPTFETGFIEYSIDGGTWAVIDRVKGNSYTWTVPDTPSNQCVLFVSDGINSAKTKFQIIGK